MSRKYRVGDERHPHFVTFTVMNWVDFFVRQEHVNTFVKSIEYCQSNKSLEVYSYCIMTSHIHLIIRTGEKHKLDHVIRDLKSYTARCFHESLLDE